MRSIVFALLMLVADFGWCGFDSGNDLKALINTSDNMGLQGMGIGYIAGVSDALSDGATVSGFKACIPVGATKKQLSDVVLHWMNNNPEYLHLTASSLTAAALSKAFPCPKK